VSPSRARPTVRVATEADIPGIRSVLAEHGNDGPHENVDIVGPYLRHLLANGRSRVVDEGDRIVAFGATIDTGRGRHLADLFVRLDRLGAGIGGPLLAEVFGDAEQRTTFASDDPRAMPLYIRAGMAPLWTSLYLVGPSGGLATDVGLTTEAAGADRVAHLERDWSGIERDADHRFWESQSGADAFVVVSDGEPVAAGYGRSRQNGTARALDRLILRPGVEPVDSILVAIGRAGRGGPVLVAIPGPNPAVRPLLAAGFRIDARDTFMASDPDLVDPTRVLPNPGLL
jgi:hypothetical protein